MTDNTSPIADIDLDATLELPSDMADPSDVTPPAAISPVGVPAETASPGQAPNTEAQGPRIRWAGVVWGLVLAALAVAGVWLTTRPDAIEMLTRAVQDTPPASAIGYAVIGVGALLLVTGLVGLPRRVQTRH